MFESEHDLDEDTREKLEQLLNAQISSVLCKIEEDEEGSQEDYSEV